MSEVVIGGGNVGIGGNTTSPVVIGGGSTTNPQYTQGVYINKQPDLACGEDGGIKVVRDTTGMTGGGSKINSIGYFYTIVGKNVKGFEWNFRADMDNYAEQGDANNRTEHCTSYFKARKYGGAPVWVNVGEVMDYTGRGAGLGQEGNYWLMPEVPKELRADNGFRYYYDIIVGDYAVANGLPGNDPTVEVGATAPFRARTSHPFAYWSFGALLEGIRESGVRVSSWVKGGVRGFELLGKWIVGADFSQADVNTAIRLKEGQVVAYEKTDAITSRFFQGRIQFLAFGTPVIEFDMSTGDIYKKGKRVL